MAYLSQSWFNREIVNRFAMATGVVHSETLTVTKRASKQPQKDPRHTCRGRLRCPSGLNATPADRLRSISRYSTTDAVGATARTAGTDMLAYLYRVAGPGATAAAAGAACLRVRPPGFNLDPNRTEPPPDAPDTNGLIGGMFVLDPPQKHPGIDDPRN